MNKQVVVFKQSGKTTVAIRITKVKSNDRAVDFEMVSATDSVDFPQFLGELEEPEEPEAKQFNILGPQGGIVAEFEEGLYICTGKVLPSSQPWDLINNKGYAYTIKFEEDIVMSKGDFEDISQIIYKWIIDLGYRVIFDEMVEDYVYTVE